MTTGAGPVVEDVRVHELRWPLDPPLDLAGRVIADRRYVVLELGLADGATGTAYCLTRGAPVFDALEGELAPRLPGCSVEQVLALARAGADAPGDADARHRAHALLDVCAWDLRAQARELPLWRCLADAARPRSALLVEGYRGPDETDADVAARLAQVVRRGARAIKLAADADPAATERLLGALRATLDADVALVVDMEGEAASVEAALAAARLWAPHRPAWIEDPFAPARVDELRAVRRASPIPLGAGDEATLPQLHALLDAEAVDVLRLDVTTAGGITGALALLGRAQVDVSFHVYPEIHRHLAFAFGAAVGIELFAPGGRFDFVDRFLSSDLLDRDGALVPPDEPGLGIAFAAAAANDHVVRRASR